MLYPTTLGSVSSQVRLAVWALGATPVPVNCSTAGETTALLKYPALAEPVPDWLGVNRSLAWMLCPDKMVTGRLSPWIENSELVTWSDEIVTFPLAAARVALRVALCPTVTLPKLSFEGDTVSPGLPVPATGMERLLLRAVMTSVNVKVKSPTAVGLKTMGNWTVLPGWSVIGNGK